MIIALEFLKKWTFLELKNNYIRYKIKMLNYNNKIIIMKSLILIILQILINLMKQIKIKYNLNKLKK